MKTLLSSNQTTDLAERPGEPVLTTDRVQPPITAQSYRVSLEKEELVFSAAHFITFNGTICERIHGHNFGVRCDVYGPLDENQYVVDFIALRDSLKEIIVQLDHHVLLPTKHPAIRVDVGESEVTATFDDRRWVFPLEDCVLLPIENTTAELIARHIASLLLDKLVNDFHFKPERLTLGVDENNGQWGICELTF